MALSMKTEENKSTTNLNSKHLEVNNEDSEIVQLPDESNPLDEIITLKDQIEALQDKLLRAAAESENTRKRFEKMVEEIKHYSIIDFAKDLLSVMDNLSRALDYRAQGNDSQVAGIIAGVDMTKTELASIFNKYGLEAIEPRPGEKFDYNLHHAISQIVTDEYEQDCIVSTMQVGYKLKERLLRPAIVTVSKQSK